MSISFCPPRLYTKQLFKHVDNTLKISKESKIASIAKHAFRFLVSFFLLFYVAAFGFGYNVLSATYALGNYLINKNIEEKSIWKDKIVHHIEYAILETAMVAVTYIYLLNAAFTALYVIIPNQVDKGYNYIEENMNKAVTNLIKTSEQKKEAMI